MNTLLIIVGLALILINYIPIKKSGNSFQDIFKKEDDLTKDYDIELMAIRKDMAESILDLQKEIEELKQIIKHSDNIVNTYDRKDIDKIEEKEESNSVVCDIDFNNVMSNEKNHKADIIRQMINDGYRDDDICKELKVGKGEVLLIRGLYK